MGEEDEEELEHDLRRATPPRQEGSGEAQGGSGGAGTAAPARAASGGLGGAGGGSREVTWAQEVTGGDGSREWGAGAGPGAPAAVAPAPAAASPLASVHSGGVLTPNGAGGAWRSYLHRAASFSSSLSAAVAQRQVKGEAGEVRAVMVELFRLTFR